MKFTVDGNEHELGPGQLVFVRDPALKRGGVALTDDAAVLALGGKPGEAYEVSAWEAMFAAVPARAGGEAGTRRSRSYNEALAEQPDNPALLYNLACMEALAGQDRRCARASAAAVEPTEHSAASPQTDEDFAAIRDDPRFPR